MSDDANKPDSDAESSEQLSQALDYQERLRALSTELGITSALERRRIAQALHDELGQTLALAKFELQGILDIAQLTQVRDHATRALDLLEKAIAETRSLTFELSPPILFTLGFEAAVEWLLEEKQRRYGFVADFHDDGADKPLDKETRILLFQIVRELMLNVVKHARAGHVAVHIRREENSIVVVVQDDGVGFEPQKVLPEHGAIESYGLFSIRERLEYYEGAFKLDSTPGRGTTARVTVPLDL